MSLRIINNLSFFVLQRSKFDIITEKIRFYNVSREAGIIKYKVHGINTARASVDVAAITKIVLDDTFTVSTKFMHPAPIITYIF